MAVSNANLIARIPRRNGREKEDDPSSSEWKASAQRPSAFTGAAIAPTATKDPREQYVETTPWPYYESQHGSKPKWPGWVPSSSAESSTLQTSTTRPHAPVSKNSAFSTSHSVSVPSDKPTSKEYGPDGSEYGEPVAEHSSASRSIQLGMIGFTLVICIIIAAALLFWRKRRRQRKLHGQVTETIARGEMKAKERPLMAGPGTTFAQPVVAQAIASSPPPPLPVILPMNGAYMSGLDTADMVSVRSGTNRTGLGDPFADGNSMVGQPPPPYRPRSTAPPSYGGTPRSTAPASLATASRNSSLRSTYDPYSHTSHSYTNTNQNGDEQNPFADPDDDDAVSVMSDNTLRQDWDNRSEVSLMGDPVAGRSW